MSKEAKVGAFALTGIALLVAVVLMLSGLSLGSSGGYRLYAGFKQAGGIQPQSQVCLSGVPVGEVLSVVNDGGGVTVAMEIKRDTKIPRGSRVTVNSAGVMGEMFINILPAGVENGLVVDGDYLIGEDATGMDTIMADISRVLDKVDNMLVSMNDVLGSKVLQQSLIQTMVNVQSTTSHLDKMMAVFESMAVENQGQVTQMLANLNAATAGMNRTMESVEAMMANLATVGADPQTAENLRLTLNNIADASQRIVNITEGLEKITTDEQTQEDIKATIHNARKLTEKADNMLGELGSIEVKPQAEVLYSGGERRWKTDFNVDVGKKDSAYVRLGVDDIGEENDLNAQIGKKSGAFGLRGGVVNGSLGAGVDLYAGDRFQFSVEGYDPNDAKLRLEAAYDVTGNGTSIVGQWDKVNDSEKRAAYVGLRQSF